MKELVENAHALGIRVMLDGYLIMQEPCVINGRTL